MSRSLSADSRIGREISGVGRRWRRRRLLRRSRTFRDVVVYPYQQLLNRPGGGHDHQGGPLWPDWERQTMARFNRDGVPCDLAPEPEQPARRLEGANHVWIGPIHPHFGHGVAEFLTRLACSAEGMADPVMVFSSRCSHLIDTVDKLPAWFVDVLGWYGVSPNQVLLVAEPARFDSLTVFPQQEQLHAVGPSAAYLDLLDEITERNLGPAVARGSSRVYVSRAGVMTGFAGEAYLEQVLERLGIGVIRPEKFSIAEQMATYRAAQTLIFAEGSALHGAQLLGRALGDVVVLTRRTGSDTGPYCEAFIRPRSRSLQYVDCVRGVLHGINNLGRPAYAAGMPLFDVEKLAAWLSTQGVEVRSLWDPAAFRRGEERSVRKWLKFSGRLQQSEASRAAILEALDTYGFASLKAEAEQLLSES